MRAVRNTKGCTKHKRTLCTNEGPAQKLPDAAPCGAQFNGGQPLVIQEAHQPSPPKKTTHADLDGTVAFKMLPPGPNKTDSRADFRVWGERRSEETRPNIIRFKNTAMCKNTRDHESPMASGGINCKARSCWRRSSGSSSSFLCSSQLPFV
jgi:hypothetical protein